MITIVYASRETAAINADGLVDLLTVARSRNEQEGVTGMLLYAYGSFMQQLEGEEEPMDRIFRSITSDPRHTDIRLFSRRPLEARRYERWAMGFEHPDDAMLAEQLSGYRAMTAYPLVNGELVGNSAIAENLLARMAGV